MGCCKQGRKGNTGTAGPTGATGPAGDALPDHVMYVSQTIPPGVDPARWFTDITPAIVAAKAYPWPLPAAVDVIKVAPGDYGPIELQPGIAVVPWGADDDVPAYSMDANTMTTGFGAGHASYTALEITYLPAGALDGNQSAWVIGVDCGQGGRAVNFDASALTPAPGSTPSANLFIQGRVVGYVEVRSPTDPDARAVFVGHGDFEGVDLYNQATDLSRNLFTSFSAASVVRNGLGGEYALRTFGNVEVFAQSAILEQIQVLDSTGAGAGTDGGTVWARNAVFMNRSASHIACDASGTIHMEGSRGANNIDVGNGGNIQAQGAMIFGNVTIAGNGAFEGDGGTTVLGTVDVQQDGAIGVPGAQMGVFVNASDGPVRIQGARILQNFTDSAALADTQCEGVFVGGNVLTTGAAGLVAMTGATLLGNVQNTGGVILDLNRAVVGGLSAGGAVVNSGGGRIEISEARVRSLYNSGGGGADGIVADNTVVSGDGNVTNDLTGTGLSFSNGVCQVLFNNAAAGGSSVKARGALIGGVPDNVPAGTGDVLRSQLGDTGVLVGAGPHTIPIPGAPYPAGTSYRVYLTQTGGVAAPVIANNQTATSFDIVGAAAGDSFAYELEAI